jgi:class 3 adenylate cyclase
VIKATITSHAETQEEVEAANPPAGSPGTAERRHLTVLQCSLSGPGFLATRLDPENLHTLLVAFHERGTRIITEAGGTVAGRSSDGILAYFGYPQADEHQAERAVRAGLGLIETARQREWDQSGPLRARVGIASGLVVISVPPTPSGEPTALGEAVVSVARLALHAPANTVVIADTTRRLVSRLFVCRQHVPLLLEDAVEPIATWTVENAALSGSRFDSLRAEHLSPFIGREAELALLIDRWRLARVGEGQAVLVCGEPGIGKSRLLKEFLADQWIEPVQAIQLQGSPHAVNSAYYPIIDNLERALAFGPDETPDTRLDKLEALIMGRYGRPRSDVPLIAAILSLPWQERYGGLIISPQKFKNQTLHTLADAMAAAARKQPTVMLFEDVHWADPTTLEAIALLIGRLARLPLLIVLTHRPEFQSHWSNYDNLTAVTLPKLTTNQSTSLILGVSQGNPLPSDLLEQILVKTDGVPLFVEEVRDRLKPGGWYGPGRQQPVGMVG